jgi:hypothetical protein
MPSWMAKDYQTWTALAIARDVVDMCYFETMVCYSIYVC